MGNLIIASCWLLFFGVWAALSIAGGSGGQQRHPLLGRVVRLLPVVAIVLAIRYSDRMQPGAFGHSTSSAAGAGAVLCVLGLAFAIWARVVLGRNWGMPMTRHAAPELVTSGPYAYVRHPIYTGIALMGIGTALAYPLGFVWCAVMIPYMVFSARREERDMATRFPETYPGYKARSKMLVPFVI
jgi:protein-S-isoprenylcysteine O-methyltransferase Ste14